MTFGRAAVKPFSVSLPADLAYYVAYPANCSDPVQAFATGF
jgi:hypothetical protein